jgi:hypothetical protein
LWFEGRCHAPSLAPSLSIGTTNHQNQPNKPPIDWNTPYCKVDTTADKTHNDVWLYLSWALFCWGCRLRSVVSQSQKVYDGAGEVDAMGLVCSKKFKENPKKCLMWK